MNSEIVLSFDHIIKSYKAVENSTSAEKLVVLDQVSGVIRAGEWWGISGPSGSGKSSLLHILGAIDAPDSGVVTFQNQRVPYDDASFCNQLRRSKIGFVFQYFHLIKHLTVLENVILPLLLNGVSQKEARERATSLLQSLNLGVRLNHLPQQLSGGEQQRVAMSRASVHKPALIIADEPTGNLDQKNRDLVLQSLEELRQSGCALLMASHSGEALRACSIQAKLCSGKLSLC